VPRFRLVNSVMSITPWSLVMFIFNFVRDGEIFNQ
jgi:hypothetical protein